MSMTRRDFLEVAAATTAIAAVGSGVTNALAAAPPKNKIKRGVASYSYQEEYFTRVMTLEDCLREMSDIGAHYIELLAEAYVPNFPNPSDAWVDQWHGWCEKYQIHPAAYTQFIDTMRTKSHNLTIEEGVQTMLRDIKLAKRLGIPRIRALIGTPIPILEATLPHLEEHGIWVGVELHAPIQISGKLMTRLLEVSEKSKLFGFVPDVGIFQNKPNPFARDRQVRDGLITHDAALYVENAWENHVDKAKTVAEVERMHAGPGAQGYVDTVYGITTQNARDLIPFMAKCQHIHGKTWGLTEDCVDPAIDLGPVIPALIEGGYDGVIATEYEGQRDVQDISPFSAVEMVRRHHVMLRRLLGEV